MRNELIRSIGAGLLIAGLGLVNPGYGSYKSDLDSHNFRFSQVSQQDFEREVKPRKQKTLSEKINNGINRIDKEIDKFLLKGIEFGVDVLIYNFVFPKSMKSYKYYPTKPKIDYPKPKKPYSDDSKK